MALKFGSTDISSAFTVKFGSTALGSVRFGADEVWKKERLIYENGVFYEGYSVTKFADSPDYSESFKVESDHIYLSSPRGSYLYVKFNKTLEFGEFSKLNIAFTPTLSWNHANSSFLVSESYSDRWTNCVKCNTATSGIAQTITLEDTAVTDDIWFGTSSNWDTGYGIGVKITRIWFE